MRTSRVLSLACLLVTLVFSNTARPQDSNSHDADNSASTNSRWDIEVTGSVEVESAGTSSNIKLAAVTLADMQITTPISDDLLKQLITNQFGEMNTLENLQVTIVENTASQISLDVSLDATLIREGITEVSAFRLHYVFSR